MAKHKQVHIAHRDQAADVDEGIAPLIKAIWRRGIRTVLSCQEIKRGIAWVQFASPEDAKRFLDAVAIFPDRNDPNVENDRNADRPAGFWEEFFDRISGQQPNNKSHWQYGVCLTNAAFDYDNLDEDRMCTGPADFHFHVSIRFPKSDMEVILEQLSRSSHRKK